MAKRRAAVLLLSISALFLFMSPRGTTQVPVDVLPPFSLQTAEDFGSLRESLQVLTANPALGFPLIDLRFRKLWSAGPSAVYVGGYSTPCGPAFFSNFSGLANLPLTLETHQFVYVHQIGGPCAVPPDSLYDSISVRPLVASKNSTNVANQLQLSFLLFLAETLELSDPGGLIPQLTGLLAQPNQGVVDLALSSIGSSVFCRVTIGDLTDPTSPTNSIIVEANYNGTIFDSVSVR